MGFHPSKARLGGVNSLLPICPAQGAHSKPMIDQIDRIDVEVDHQFDEHVQCPRPAACASAGWLIELWGSPACNLALEPRSLPTSGHPPSRPLVGPRWSGLKWWPGRRIRQRPFSL
jgi:hypothetical protein